MTQGSGYCSTCHNMTAMAQKSLGGDLLKPYFYRFIHGLVSVLYFIFHHLNVFSSIQILAKLLIIRLFSKYQIVFSYSNVYLCLVKDNDV